MKQSPKSTSLAASFRPGIWTFAFGYFACYVPYSALTKAVSKGLIPNIGGPIPGLELLPISVSTSALAMLVFITLMGWWRYATHSTIGGISIPHPSLWTFLSGLCTATIIVTTTLAYTFQGISIVFAMLLMRGGVLCIAPIIDRITGREVRWYSWAGLVLSLLALIAAFAEDGGTAITVLAALDIAAYLGGYFIRLQFMSRLAKSDDSTSMKRYFVEEQVVATPVVVLLLALGALFAPSDLSTPLSRGFTELWSSPALIYVVLIGLLSQGTGVFGGLILLDKRENTYCVPVNRSSSILAGVVASLGLWYFLGNGLPSIYQFVGATLIITAILVLTLPPLMEKKSAAAG